jgi:hypothetical protein
LLPLLVDGQQTSVSELEIKTGGLYYYVQVIEVNKEKAKEEARNELIASVIKDIGVSSGFQPGKDWMVGGIEYLFFPRGDKTRAIGYILKTKVKELDSKGKLQVNQVRYEEEPNITESVKLVKQVEKVSTESAGTIAKIPEPKIVQKPGNKSPDLEKDHSGNGILKKLISIKKTTDLALILSDFKSEGLLAFGDQSSMVNPEKYYFIVFSPEDGAIVAFLNKADIYVDEDGPKNEDGAIVAFLNKGAGNSRTNLLDNTIVEDFLLTYKNKKIVWLQIF